MKIITSTTFNLICYSSKRFQVFFGLFLLCMFSTSMSAQLTNLGTDINGSYTNYATNTLTPGLKQVRVQETSNTSSGTRKWEWNADSYFNTWRSASGQTIAGYNQFISPNSGNASAFFRASSGGSSAFLPATVSGRYYTFNVTYLSGTYRNENMAVLETTFNPVAISGIGVAFTAGKGSYGATSVSLTSVPTLSSGENLYCRYTTNSYTNSTLIQITPSGSTGSFSIPAQVAGANVSFYFYTSNQTLSAIQSSVTLNGETAHDMLLLNLLNNSGSNYTYTQPSGNVLVNCSAGTTTPTFYTTLKGAFDAVNAGTHQGVITMAIYGNTTETATAALNASGSGAASYTSIGIQPAGGAARTITGALAASIINLNGADNVTIDGLNAGGNSLTISNTSTAATAGTSTIQLRADATINTIQNCTILGSATATAGGTIIFSTGTTTGNDTNTIIGNTIGAAGTNLPLCAIYSAGTSTTVNNSGNTVSNNNIADYFNAASASYGINVASNSSAWTISSNKFYQAATRTSTAGSIHEAIKVTTASGVNYTITNNTIGFANAAGTGTTFYAGAFANRFIGIDLAVGTATASSVQGNTITNFNLSTTAGTTGTSGIFTGIYVTSGNVNIGTTTGNLIGNTTGTGFIFITTTTTGGLVTGITSSSTGTVSIQNNTIASISCTGTAAIGYTFTGIGTSGAAGIYTISSNVIGSTTVANSIQVGVSGTTTSGVCNFNGISNTATGVTTISSNTIQNISVYGTTGAQSVYGIVLPVGFVSDNTATISTNTIANITQTGTGATTASFVYGIAYLGGPVSASVANIVNITNNIINNLSGANANVATASGTLSVIGIYFAPINTIPYSAPIITGNTINTLSATNTGALGTNVAGIVTTATGGTGTVNTNKIYDIRNASTGTTATTPPTATGIYVRNVTAGSMPIHNNMISLGNGQTTNTLFAGIWNGLTATQGLKAYFNSVSISGTAGSGALPSFGFLRSDLSTTAITSAVDIQNNIFSNTRTGGTGKHYAIANNYGATASTTGWPAAASNYNVLNGTAANIGYWTSDRTFAAWQTASSGDANSYSGITVTFANVATGDLHLNMGSTTTALESAGNTISGITTDYDSQTRPGGGTTNGGGLAPDLGADEFDGTPIPPTIVLSTNNIVAGSLTQGALVPIYSFGIGVSVKNASLTGLGITTTGSYALADITDFKVYYQTTSTWTGTGTLLSTYTNLGGASTFTFPSFSSQSIASGTTGYIFIAATVPCGASATKTVAVNAVTGSNTTFALGTATGTPAAGTTQTAPALTVNNVTSPAASLASFSSVLTWTNPTGCVNEILIVAAPASNTGTPTGDGTAYAANLAYGSGTGLGNGFVVYKGSASSQTVTALTNGTAYYYKFFTRSGTTWSSGVEVGPITPGTTYCTPTITTGNDIIQSFSINTLSNLNSGGTTNPNYYTNYPSSSFTTTLYKNQSYTALFSSGAGSLTHAAGIWIDFNQDGDFQDTGEFTLISNSIAANTSNISATVAIPSTANSGTTRLRVRYIYASSPNLIQANECTSYTYGETEDYTVTIDVPPSPTITSLGTTAGCVGTSITINGTDLTGVTAANVKIGGTPVSSITSNSGTVLVAVIGAGTTGAVTVTTAGGTATSSATFTVNPLPTVAWASTATSVCQNATAQTTTLAYTATTDAPITYSITWSSVFATVTDASFSGAAGGGTIIINVPANAAAGTYTGTITAKNANGCTTTGTQTFTIVIGATPIATAANSGPYCEGSSIVLTSGNPGFANYTWSGPNSFTATNAVQTYTQNFDGLPTGTVWTDNVSLLGWYINGTNYLGQDTGASGTGGMRNYGVSAGATNRTFGSLNTATSAASGSAGLRYAVKITNTTGQAVNSINVSYSGMQFRNQTATVDKLIVDYQLNATSITTGTWTAIPALDFNSPNSAALPSTTLLSTNVLLGTPLANGDSIWIRWNDLDVANSDDGLGIDDVTVSLATNTVTIPNATPAMAGLYTLTVTHASGCTATASTTVVVNPTSVAGTITGAGSVCTGTNSTTLTLNGSTGSIQWQSSSDNSTFNDISGQTASTLLVTNLSTTTYYRAVVISGVCASATTTSFTITVDPTPTTANAGLDQSVCSTNTITLAANTATSGTGAWSIISGSGGTVTTPSSPTSTFTGTAGTTYTLRWTISSGACAASTDDVVITIFSPLDFVNLQFPGSATICQGTSLTAFGQVYEPGVTPGAGTQGPNITVEFGYNGTNTNPSTWTNWDTASFNSTGGGTNNDEYQYVFTPSAAGTYYYAFRYKQGTCDSWQYGGYSGSGGGTWGGSNVSGVLTVNSNAAHTIALTSGSSTPALCQNTLLGSNIVYSIGGGATGAGVTGLPSGMSGTFSSGTFTISGTPTTGGTYNYTVTTTGNGCATAVTATGTITVSSTLDFVNLQFPASGTICQTSTFTAYGQVFESGVTQGAGQGAGITVEFGYDTTNSNPSTWSNWFTASHNPTVSGNNDEYLYTLSPPSSGTFYYAFRYKQGTCDWQYGGYTSGGGGTWGGSNVSGVLTVNPTLAASVSIAASATTICSGTSVTFTATPTNGGSTPSYQWKVNGVNAGTNSATFTSTTLANNDVVSVVLTSNATPCLTGSPATSNTLTMTVNPAVVASVSASASATTICAGTSVTFTATPTNGGTTPAYQWQVNGTNVSGETGSTFTTTTLANTDVVTVVLTSNAFCVSGSPATSTGITITVTPNVTPTFAPVATICAGSPLAALPTTSNNGITGTWSPALDTTTTTVYTFTPTAGQCATTATLTITVGGTVTWNGTAWDNVTGPTSTDTAVFAGNYTIGADFNACSIQVNSGAVVSVTSGFNVNLYSSITVASGGSFTLNNNANLYQANASAVNTGNIIVKRNSNPLIRLDYTLWSSPVAGQGLLAFSPLTSISPTIRFYTYNTSSNLYSSVASPSTTNFATGTGYLIRLPFNHPTAPAVWAGSFTGVPNNGTKTIALTNIDETHQFNAVGNPYPSPISISQFATDNAGLIEPTLYFWRKTNNTNSPSYCTWNTTSGTFGDNNEAYTNTPNGVIQTGQGFIVEAKGNANTLTFNNGQRTVNNANQFFKSSTATATTDEAHRIWLNLTGTGAEFSQAVVGYFTNATLGSDDYDSKYFNDGAVALNMKIAGTDYVIQGRPAPFDATDVVPLNYKVTTAGTYNFTLDHVDGLFTGGAQNIYIKDNLDATYHNITSGSYSFTSAAGTFADRFELVYTDSALNTDNQNFDANNIVVYHQQNDVVINTGAASMATVRIFDIRGRLLVEKKDINSSETRINVGTTNQVLVVQVTTTEGLKATKKVIN